ncbi:hypothetical protein EHF33_16070 [Deinococcus psychrotolerans]|uniref:Yip1 domain-containing protein n=1 Tax=Deinococcus psychrotolerans TaxID=2489213 RepID=A0A3G8YHC4_9DEIO|nr:hypothetical protein [Deinococcus psychrotolerans]AZI44393.1 hypothetical protein EHF33_16070 [Deinococcus psychrotolerans]
MMMIPEDDQLYLIQSKSNLLTGMAFGAYTLVSVYVGLEARAAGLGSLNTGLWVLSGLSGIVNASLALLLFPLVFTWLSRRFGAETLLAEVRSISALSLMPVILGTLLGTLGWVPLWAGVACVASTTVFAHGLSLANGTRFGAALKHTLAVWGVLLVSIVVLNGVFLAVRTVR